ncbi:Membrane protein involved in the export of O-antigen and teichoic acid [Natronorubrum sediminis]|uniref:Membrane protein involved in the export of O-antigen and teichoic acid n=1 Tax=Natronorubrum sediminis TaxID=640943 RepID=A0A1H6FZZ2_9EURY|nr:polysaccharide biosynthesis C-terminal domain-containing protein [Natronorubrum sediminis]SEH15900.1 Membrane protein involved in the export of O-antigen and teichoic acid [Natronorubrum sediminis]
MNIGQTSLIVFLSKLLGSALGFVATLYFARELGAEVLGVYTLVLTVVSWLILAGEFGVGQATTKRISEGREQGAYLSAALVWITGFAVCLSLAVIVAQPILESYIAEFDHYVALSVVWFVVALLFIKLFYRTIDKTLKGERKVHIEGVLEPVKIGGQSLIQIVLVIAGYGLLGMLVGYALGGIIVGIVGLYWVSTQPSMPSKRHFVSLFDYAKFSWLGSLKSRTFNEVDILLLGVFAQSALVGVYSVAWSIAKFLDIFGGAVSSTMFPEISHTSAQNAREAVSGLVEDSLAFTGLIAIPGIVGGTLLADRLLELYGPEFVDGATVLALLIVATTLYSYQKQLMNGLNGIDRPDLAFRINAVFIVLNAGLNVVLIPRFGLEGAAIASIASVAVATILAYVTLSRLVDFRTPFGEIGRQITAALVMGVVVYGALETVETTAIVEHNAFIVVSLVGFGAGVYFLTLLALSARFRSTVERNIPLHVPYLS